MKIPFLHGRTLFPFFTLIVVIIKFVKSPHDIPILPSEKINTKVINPGIVSGMTKVHIEGINPNSNTGTNSIPKYLLLVIGAVNHVIRPDLTL